MGLIDIFKKKEERKEQSKCARCLRPIAGSVYTIDSNNYCRECYNRKMAVIQQTEGQKVITNHSTDTSPNNTFVCDICKKELPKKYLHSYNICADCANTRRTSIITPISDKKSATISSSNTYDKMVGYAYRLIEVIETKCENDEMVYMRYLVLMLGIGNAKVSQNPDADHNYQAVIDALHLYHTDHQDKSIKEKDREALLKTIDVITNKVGIQNVLNHIFYEMKKENDGSSCFQLDWEYILPKFQSAIQKLYTELKSESDNFDAWIQYHNDYMKRKYGKEFWTTPEPDN